MEPATLTRLVSLGWRLVATALLPGAAWFILTMVSLEVDHAPMRHHSTRLLLGGLALLLALPGALLIIWCS